MTRSADAAAWAAEPTRAERAQIGGVVGGRLDAVTLARFARALGSPSAVARRTRPELRRRLGRVSFRGGSVGGERVGAARAPGAAQRGRRSVRTCLAGSAEPAPRARPDRGTRPVLRPRFGRRSLRFDAPAPPRRRHRPARAECGRVARLPLVRLPPGPRNPRRGHLRAPTRATSRLPRQHRPRRAHLEPSVRG